MRGYHTASGMHYRTRVRQSRRHTVSLSLRTVRWMLAIGTGGQIQRCQHQQLFQVAVWIQPENNEGITVTEVG